MQVMNTVDASSNDKYPENIEISPIQRIIIEIEATGQEKSEFMTLTMSKDFSQYKFVYIVANLGWDYKSSMQPVDPKITLIPITSKIDNNYFPMNVYIPNVSYKGFAPSQVLFPELYKNFLYNQYYIYNEYIGAVSGDASTWVYIRNINKNAITLEIVGRRGKDAYSVTAHVLNAMLVGFY